MLDSAKAKFGESDELSGAVHVLESALAKVAHAPKRPSGAPAILQGNGMPPLPSSRRLCCPECGRVYDMPYLCCVLCQGQMYITPAWWMWQMHMTGSLRHLRPSFSQSADCL